MKEKQTSGDLAIKIGLKREELYHVARIKGINHKNTIKCSQQLDSLLAKHSKMAR